MTFEPNVSQLARIEAAVDAKEPLVFTLPRPKGSETPSETLQVVPISFETTQEETGLNVDLLTQNPCRCHYGEPCICATNRNLTGRPVGHDSELISALVSLKNASP